MVKIGVRVSVMFELRVPTLGYCTATVDLPALLEGPKLQYGFPYSRHSLR